MPEWKRELRRKTQSCNQIKHRNKVIPITNRDERQCYSCGRMAHLKMMSICNICGSMMCMQDEDCKAFCLCDMYESAVQAR